MYFCHAHLHNKSSSFHEITHFKKHYLHIRAKAIKKKAKAVKLLEENINLRDLVFADAFLGRISTAQASTTKRMTWT